tara:strand:- start:633 stop:884 length:252 start_codon:yes stop_codon:yes gene_type:complete
LNNELLKSVLGQSGALVLALIFLYQIMGSYELLIANMLQDAKEDRTMYHASMNDLSQHIDSVNSNLISIQKDIEIIKNFNLSK